MFAMSHEGDMSRGCGIVTVSATHQADSDESGSLVRSALIAAGHRIVHQRWVSDDLSNCRYIFREWVDDSRFEVIIAIGGTGLAARDITPEALAPLVTKQMPGFGEIFRMLAWQQLGVAALESRAMAAVCHATLVYAVPGTPEAVELAVNQLILPQLSQRLPTQQIRPMMLPKQRIPANRPG
jgi:molybdenum cofactor biosynthesis protein B